MKDLINRQDAISIAANLLINDEKYHMYNQGVNNYAAELVELPAVDSDATDVNAENFESKIHAMFDHIWDCEIEHPVFQDTVGELMNAVIQCYNRLPATQPDFNTVEKIDKAYDDGYKCGYLQAKSDYEVDMRGEQDD